MLEIKETSVGNRSVAQALELSLVVDLEACWENLRKNPQVGNTSGPHAGFEEPAESLRCFPHQAAGV